MSKRRFDFWNLFILNGRKNASHEIVMGCDGMAFTRKNGSFWRGDVSDSMLISEPIGFFRGLVAMPWGGRSGSWRVHRYICCIPWGLPKTLRTIAFLSQEVSLVVVQHCHCRDLHGYFWSKLGEYWGCPWGCPAGPSWYITSQSIVSKLVSFTYLRDLQPTRWAPYQL